MRLAQARSAALVGGVRVQVGEHTRHWARGDLYGTITKVKRQRKGAIPRVHVRLDGKKRDTCFYAEDIGFIPKQGGSSD